jgi:CheY-like chemotaxis protein/anti-sigma regulatory factor (Ser/Thr protein kinase)
LGVHADEKRLRQVLINLLGNAVKFTESGGVSLKVGRQYGKIRFQIEDSGLGIAEEDLRKIFEPFQQVGEQTYKAEGTGLGLPITQRLVKMMGGDLHVESELGKGSVFWMELDLPEVAQLATAEQRAEPLIIGFAGPPRRLFIVDDKRENRLVMTNLLTPLGFHVIEANNGQVALEKMSETRPDLIITDLIMPTLDGFEMVRRLRKMPEFAQIPIIAASASVFDYHQENSLAVGCNAFIATPFRVETLLQLLAKYLKVQWIYAESVVAPQEEEETNAPMVGPTPQQVEILYELAMMGDIAGILNELKKLEESNSSLLPFIHKIRQFAKNFDEEQICQLIESHRMS